MPIKYSVSDDGHFINAVASGLVTAQEFIEYELAHAVDKRIRTPLYELLVIEPGAFRQIATEDISRVIEQRMDLPEPPVTHHCAIVVAESDYHAWDLAKFYEGMFRLHYPEVVIVFADPVTARIWLGMEKD
ncbi:MAG TPA: hypothetical protein G4O18_02020 [Dehalococcoidia bacterium]|nr:hypothetical protein [Dehalococcoidia bacterium]